MLLPVSSQISAAVASIALGAAAGFFYDFLRALRRRLRSAAATALIDVLFWAVFGVSLFLLGFTLGGGEHRIYMSLLAVLGGALYFLLLSSLGLWLCDKIAGFLAFLIKCALKPLTFTWQFHKKVLEIIKNTFIFEKKCCKIRKNTANSFLNGVADAHAPAPHGGVDIETEAFRYSYKNNSDHTGRVRGNIASAPAGAHRGGKPPKGAFRGSGRRA
ncbi:MAG: spore cortex biosynthesis protein YabQ [Oscillospiraceae bacterium]|nr:spore cortex biosynthesis protein YabQ [Oscillospiraceae bacterium]